MGGNNTKDTKNTKESKTEYCTNPRGEKVFSITKIDFTLQRDTRTNHVTLQDLEFRINLPHGRFVSSRICSVSNDIYLLPDNKTKCVLKLQVSTGKNWELPLPGYVEDLFFLEENIAAAAIQNTSSNYIYLIKTDVLCVIKAIDIKKNCKGMAHIESMFYIGHSNGIAVYNNNG